MYGNQQSYLNWVIRETLTEEVTFELRTDCKKSQPHRALKQSFSGNDKCPKTENNLECAWKEEKAVKPKRNELNFRELLIFCVKCLELTLNSWNILACYYWTLVFLLFGCVTLIRLWVYLMIKWSHIMNDYAASQDIPEYYTQGRFLNIVKMPNLPKPITHLTLFLSTSKQDFL